MSADRSIGHDQPRRVVAKANLGLGALDNPARPPLNPWGSPLTLRGLASNAHTLGRATLPRGGTAPSIRVRREARGR